MKSVKTIAAKFKSLPTKNKKILGLSVTIFLTLLIPLLLWGFLTNRFDLRERAGLVTPPVTNPGGCVPINKVITVTPESPSSTCTDIQTAINAVTGDGFTISIQPGEYIVNSQINISGKNNLTILGSSDLNDLPTNIIFKHTGFGFNVTNTQHLVMQFLDISGHTSNGMLSVRNSAYYSFGFSKIHDQSAHTMDIQNTAHISVYETEIRSSAGGLELAGVSYATISNNLISQTNNALSINDSSYVHVIYNALVNNSESGLRMRNVQQATVDHNTINNNFMNNSTSSAGAVDLMGQITDFKFTNNLVTYNRAFGMKYTGNSFTRTVGNNDFYNNTSGNFSGIDNYIGINGNIDLDPKMSFELDDLYCLKPESPAIYADPKFELYMGHRGPCNTPTPSPTPISCANPFQVEITPLDKVGKPGQILRYGLRVSNLNSSCQPYNVSLSVDHPSNWSVTMPTSSFLLAPNHTYDTYLEVTSPSSNYSTGQQALTLRINSLEQGNMGTHEFSYTLIEDPFATPTSSPRSQPIPGDISGDGIVNIVDIGIIIDHYRSSPPTHSGADINKDGIVNIVDIGIVIDNYDRQSL